VRAAAAILLGAIAVSRIAVTADNEIFFMELSPDVLPYTVGGNAFAVAGTLFDGGAFSWMPTAGTQSIGGRSAIAISHDGRVIVGRALDARGLENAAIWTSARTWRLLGSFTPDAQPCDQLLSSAFGASDDGSVVVGLGWNGCRIAHAFRWEEKTGMVDLGISNANSSRANGISGDGRIVVGWQQHPTGFRQGAKWVNLKQEIIQGPAGMVGEAFAANRDGSLIVGEHCNPASTTVRSAWTWTASAGVRCFPVVRPAHLPDLPYSVAMLSTSDNGRIIGGAFTFGLDSEALLWLDGESHFLSDYLRATGRPNAFQGWVNTGFITSVSADGRTLVGFGAGPRRFQGYLVILPERLTR
jgi:probable HAF family extracellular repeat protein